MKRRTLFALILISIPLWAAALNRPVWDPERLEIPETSDLRRLVLENLRITGSSGHPSIESQRERDFRVKVEYQAGAGSDGVFNEAVYKFIPEALVPQRVSHSISDGSFPLYRKGAYEIVFNKKDWSVRKVRIYLKDADLRDPNQFLRDLTYLEISPRGRRASGDLVIFGVPMFRGIDLPITMDEAATLGFFSLVERTRYRIPWEWVYPETTAPYSDVMGRFSDFVRSEMRALEDRDDGAQAEDGSWVLIESREVQDSPGVNCSGFAKWVADQGRELSSLDALVTPRYRDRGHIWSDPEEADRQPYFGLDWIRNLALVSRGLSVEDSSASVDVTALPFGVYTPNVGYDRGDLGRVLLQLATLEPGFFYLGSVNSPYEEMGKPVLRQHTHVVVLFPWYDQRGQFHLRIFSRGEEVSLESLENRPEGTFVHLVRIPVIDREWIPGWSSLPAVLR